jgi:ribosomal protein S18 acetylase RimI-like enzyme
VSGKVEVAVRNMAPDDFPGIISLCSDVYASSIPWNEQQLASHLKVFPEGQLVAVDQATQQILGMSASLIVFWDDYDMQSSWRDFTERGTFTNHDPERGRTLYGAEVMVRPSLQGRGIGSKIYQARRDLVCRLKLLRIRAGARLRGYHKVASQMGPEDYVVAVLRGSLSDPTLSFQLRHGFKVMGVVSGYLQHDNESLGYAAVIEWINSEVARPEDYAGQDSRFQF